MDLTGLSPGDWFRVNHHSFHYLDDFGDTAVVTTANVNHGGSELPEAITATDMPIPSGSKQLIPIAPTNSDLTLSPPDDAMDRIIWNVGTEYDIILPDATRVKPTESYLVALDPVGSWISAPVDVGKKLVVGVGSALPDASNFAAGKMFLLHTQTDPADDGWYKVTDNGTDHYWVHVKF